MTILKKIGLGYAVVSTVSILVAAWLGYHEFVDEPAEFAAKGLKNIHKDTTPEALTVAFFGLLPLLLAAGWWWLQRVLAPLSALTEAVEEIGTYNLRRKLPQKFNGDEVDKLTAVFNSMTLRLDQSIQQIREFTLQASHELKTPLTVMRCQLDVALNESERLPPDLRLWMESQIGEIERLSKIVDSLTLLTQADARILTLERNPIELGDLVREAFEDAQILAQSQSIAVTLDECTDQRVCGDRHRIRQLLLILTDNAVKYNRPNGFLRISLRTDGHNAELRMINSGIGIKPDTAQQMFDRFIRGDNAKGRVEGSGLGLSIAKSIVTGHEGTITLKSVPGQTTTVTVRIPWVAKTGADNRVDIWATSASDVRGRDSVIGHARP